MLHLEYEHAFLQRITHKRKQMGSGINTLKPRQNGRHFAANIFKFILRVNNCCTGIKIPMIFVKKRSNWQYASSGSDSGLTPNERIILSEPMVVYFTDTHIRHPVLMS